jgi:Ran GTPase-activating protein (RanGAP) involved in mRNA processing and transport
MLFLVDDSLRAVEFPDTWDEAKIERVFMERVRGNTALQSLSICNKAYMKLGEKDLVSDLQSAAITSSCLRNLELRGEPYEENEQGQSARASLGRVQDLHAFLTASSSLSTLKLAGCSLGSRVIRPVCGLPTEADAGVDVDYIEDEGLHLISQTLRLHSSLRCLHMPSNRLTLCKAGSFPQALKQHLALQVLDLSVNNIGRLGAKMLADVLKEITGLQSLTLRTNFIGSEGTRHIADSLKFNTTLTLLDLANNYIEEKGIIALADAVKQNSTLQVLDVSRNCVQATGATALAQALAGNTVLQDLNLENTQIGKGSGAGASSEALGRLLEQNSGLRRLRLGHNGISEGNAIPLGKALGTNSTLQVLDLSQNQLTVSDAQAIGAGLKRNTTLESLVVDPFGLLKEDMEPLADALTQTSSLRHLKWTQYRIHNDSAKIMAKAAGSNLSLQYLDLSAWTLCTEGMWEMCTALASHPALLVLKLFFSPRPECAGCHDAIFHLLTYNKKLQHLDADTRDPITADRLLLALVANSTLQSLRLECSHAPTTDALVGLHAITVTNSSMTNIDVTFREDTAGALAQDCLIFVRLHSLAATMSRNPRFGTYTLKGIPFTWARSRIGLPEKNPEGEEWTDEGIPAYFHKSGFDRLAAFVMGMHPRAGQASYVRSLSDDNVQLIVSNYFRLSWKYPEKYTEPEYVSLLKRFAA